MNRYALLARKAALAFVATFVGYFAADALGIIGAPGFEWSRMALNALGTAALGALTRTIVAMLTAYVPSDAQHGANLAGAYKP
jgi:hypothetical protein